MSLGGESLPFAITAKSENPDVAAAYIDFLTNADAARVLVRDGQPAGDADDRAARQRRCARTCSPPGSTLTDREGIVPYLDYATPSFYDDITGADPAAAGGQAGAGRVHAGRPGRLRRRSSTFALTPRRRARRAASATCTCCRRSRSSGCSCSCRWCTARGSRCSPGTGVTQGRVGRARQLLGARQDADLRRGVRPLAGAARLLRRAAGRHRAAARRGASRARECAA